jgi:GNAT superfamily N-acetyltransferase
MGPVRIVVEPHAPEDVRQVVRDHLDSYNVAATGRADWAPVTFFLRDATDEIQGGLLGQMWGGWLHVAYLWVSEPLRTHGWGRALLERAERHAGERGCRDVFLSSFSFQAPGFYRKQGYEEFGALSDFPPGHTHHFFRKRLGESAPVGDAPPAPERADP